MLIYLADLVHNYYPGLNTVPLNIAYLAAYAKKRLGDRVEIRLFKYCEELLDEINVRPPSVIGLSNYTWNESLNDFVGKYAQQHFSEIPIIMGGPNIRTDSDGIAGFLKANEYVDVYITLEGEVPFASLLEEILRTHPDGSISRQEIRRLDVGSCFSLVSGELNGKESRQDEADLDFIPSPYSTGILDAFLTPEFKPLFETNRGCPYSCSYCSWGISARKHIRKFSRERVNSDMEYVAGRGTVFPRWIFADANFGVFARDVEIARDIRAVYDKWRPFQTLTVWWDKNAKTHIVKIAEILKGLSRPYVAFQTFDPAVEMMINRRNISVDQLLKIQRSLPASSYSFHTDILLGLPGETMDSHLSSLSKAYELGFDSIGGGEIRLLKGSELETDESRHKFRIKTKYRLVQEGFGMYKGQFVADLEESVRSTLWISEEEMLSLRVLRAIFFGAITIGELAPLAKCLKKAGVRIIDVFQKIIDLKDSDPLVAESVDWLSRQARNEWFDSKEDALSYFANEENRRQLLDNPVTKLNYDFLSYLLISSGRYRAFHEFLCAMINEYFHVMDGEIVHELSMLCRQRNYIVQCLDGHADASVGVALSDETIQRLIDAEYVNADMMANSDNVLSLKIDGSIATTIRTALGASEPKIQTVSYLCQSFPVYLEPGQSCDASKRQTAAREINLVKVD